MHMSVTMRVIVRCMIVSATVLIMIVLMAVGLMGMMRVFGARVITRFARVFAIRMCTVIFVFHPA
jgi:hypothetical protein